MTRFSVFALVSALSLPITTVALAHDTGYTSASGAALASCTAPGEEQDPTAKADAALAFLAALNEDQRGLVHHALDSAERTQWTNIPARGDVGGLRLGDLDDGQMQTLCTLLGSVLSAEGFEKLQAIMLGDDLRSIIDGEINTGVGIGAFRLVLFGEPSAETEWALQLDGHHVALNVTLDGNSYSMSPSFIGIFPRHFTVADEDLSPMEGEVDLAHQFLASLSAEQRAKAVVSETRGKIVTGPGNDGVVPEPEGLSGATLNGTQTGLLLALAAQWIDMMPPSHARATRSRFLDGLDNTWFSWSGPTEPGSDISYRIQGPDIVIEFAFDQRGGADGGDPTNHVHTMFRDLANEYGG
ncbi:DUF3500 domain-containing protein [Ruegeria sp.]|uniref:DUF3500 domain-containing protein n=1 Tax=Ruegeria sp. TaxID=1879320 RepID=UPI0023155CC3|nr:DUF3500 domain-containing protein [Ruegeria sp.]MDA7966683.1 DUF3500 domain-containing protein [Ruegeria sp.]